MGRKRKGRALHGWLVIDKPAGVTSTSVVNKVRWALNAQKAGHAGTLDPDATGVLAIALGEATKTVPFITDALKCYQFEVQLGSSTTTDDASGDVLATSDLRPTDAQIEAALAAFRGDIMQVPPQFSAVKVEGERAYDLAREGEAMTLAARPLWVDSLVMTGRSSPDTVALEMVCGKGGYVRSIARDMGAALGCLGHVAWLRRTWSGPFEADDALPYDRIEAMAHTPELDALIQPLELGLADLPMLPCTPEGAARLRNGNPCMVISTGGVEYGEEAWAALDGQAIAVGHYRAGELHPSRVFQTFPRADDA
jgi:tRNA pseudouridine55 synthase